MTSNKGMAQWYKVLTKRALRSCPVFLALPLVPPPILSPPILSPSSRLPSIPLFTSSHLPLRSQLLQTPASSQVLASHFPWIQVTGEVSEIPCSEARCSHQVKASGALEEVEDHQESQCSPSITSTGNGVPWPVGLYDRGHIANHFMPLFCFH